MNTNLLPKKTQILGSKFLWENIEYAKCYKAIAKVTVDLRFLYITYIKRDIFI